MGYLNKATITVDAILTNRGRELLAQGGTNSFQITKFAVADDEVDYSLYFPNHPQGSPYAGNVIENMPLMEATPDESQIMRYKLVTFVEGTDTGLVSTDGTFILPTINNFGETDGAATSLVASTLSAFTEKVYTPTTNGSIVENYTLLVANTNIVDILIGAQTAANYTRNADGSVTLSVPSGNSVKFKTRGTRTGTTTATIFGELTGATKTITISITAS